MGVYDLHPFGLVIYSVAVGLRLLPVLVVPPGRIRRQSIFVIGLRFVRSPQDLFHAVSSFSGNAAVDKYRTFPRFSRRIPVFAAV